MKPIMLLAPILSLILMVGTIETARAQIDGDALALMKGIKVDKAQVKQMLDLMEQSGQISKEMADKARSELDKKSDSEIQALQEVAIKKLEKGEDIKLPANVGTSPSTSNPVTPVASSATTATSATTTAANEKPAAASSPQPAKSEEELKNALQFLNSK